MRLYSKTLFVGLALLAASCGRTNVYSGRGVPSPNVGAAGLDSTPTPTPTATDTPANSGGSNQTNNGVVNSMNPTPTPTPTSTEAIPFAPWSTIPDWAGVYANLPWDRYFSADFDGDGKSDLAFLWPNGTIWVAHSTGRVFNYELAYENAGWGGVFASPSDARFFIADFNRDGKADIAFSWSDGTIWIGYSDGHHFNFQNAYSFQAWGPVLDSHSQARFFQGDFNGDGKSDIAFLWPDGTFWVGLFDGAHFNFALFYQNAGWGSVFTASSNGRFFAGDFNGDGKTDICFLWPDGNLWLGLSDGAHLTFNLAYSQPGWGGVFAANSPGRFYLGDFNGDHRIDIGFTWPDGTIWIGTYTGGTNFVFQLAYAAPAESGWADAVFAITSPATFIPGDWNGDGKTDFGFLYPNGAVWVAPAVVDASGNVGFTFGVWAYYPQLALAFTPGQGARYFGGDFDGNAKPEFGFFWRDGTIWVGLSTGTSFVF